MRIADPIKITAEAAAKRRRQAALPLRAVPIKLPADSLDVLNQVAAATGLSAPAILGHALLQGTQENMLAAFDALAALHLARVREVEADPEIQEVLPRPQQKKKGTL